MKTSISARLTCIVVLIALLPVSCSKSGGSGTTSTPSPAPSPSPVITPTSLTLTVTDVSNLKVAGANVRLYISQADYTNKSNQIGLTQITDVNGSASFASVLTTKCWVDIDKGCQSNVNTTSALTLLANTANKVTIPLSATGSIKLVNSSTNPYNVYLNGTLTVPGLGAGKTVTLDDLPIGAYTIRVIQVSGYVVTPTDKSYAGILTCGATLVATFP